MIRFGLEWYQTKSATFLALFALAAVIMGGSVWIATVNFKQDTDRFLYYEESKTNYTLFKINQQRGVVSELDVAVPEDPYVGWKDFRNKFISFKYPPTWQIYRVSGDGSSVGITSETELPEATSIIRMGFSFDNSNGQLYEEAFSYVVDDESRCEPVSIGGMQGQRCNPAISFAGEDILFVNDVQNFDYFSIISDYYGTDEETLILDSIVFPDRNAEEKTYSNEELGYELRYPSNWFVEEEAGRVSFRNHNDPDFEISDHTIENYTHIRFSVRVDAKSEDESLKDWVSDLSSSASNPVSNVESLTISGKSAVKGTVPSIGVHSQLYFIDLGTDIFEISYLRQDQFIDTHEQIISSFMFTDETVWKTYRNEEFGFQFQYPDKGLECDMLWRELKNDTTDWFECRIQIDATVGWSSPQWNAYNIGAIHKRDFVYAINESGFVFSPRYRDEPPLGRHIGSTDTHEFVLTTGHDCPTSNIDLTNFGDSSPHCQLYHQLTEGNIIFTQIEKENKGWETYRNEEFGIEFQYKDTNRFDVTDSGVSSNPRTLSIELAPSFDSFAGFFIDVAEGDAKSKAESKLASDPQYTSEGVVSMFGRDWHQTTYHFEEPTHTERAIQLYHQNENIVVEVDYWPGMETHLEEILSSLILFTPSLNSN